MRLSVSHVSVAVVDRVLFSPITFDITSGQSVALVAPSGAGKTTLLAAIAGFHPNRTGDLVFDGVQHIEWLIQSAPLLNRRSALDNAMTAGAIRYGPSPQLVEGALSLLDQLGLSHLRRSPAYRLSGGERQRVALSRALLARPDLLLADEPTASLDPSARDAVLQAISRACDEGCATIIATHDPAVAGFCDAAIVLDPLPVSARS